MSIEPSFRDILNAVIQIVEKHKKPNRIVLHESHINSEIFHGEIIKIENGFKRKYRYDGKSLIFIDVYFYSYVDPEKCYCQ